MNNESAVVLKLEGGLGNQLFQLAAGYYLAAKLGRDLHIDQYSIPLTTVHGERGIGFDAFGALELPKSRIIKILPNLPNSIMLRIAKQNSFIKKVLIKLRVLSSNPSRLKLFLETNEKNSIEKFLDVKIPMKLHGNFQSWDVVEKAALFGFPRVLQLKNQVKWINKLEESFNLNDSIVLHFRVGDDTRSNYFFKQPEPAYYIEGLRLLKSKRKFCKVYILSDDIARVKEMFGEIFTENVQYLEMPEYSTAAERLYVLSLFGGIVCANSTFCGWAAWSIYNSGGDVVVPVPYSDGPVLGSRDFPSKWVQLNKYSGAVVQ